MTKTESGNIQQNVKRPFMKKHDYIGWLIMLPTLILFAFFVWEPLIESVRLSLYTAKGFRIQEFVGLRNYRNVLKDPVIFIAFKNTFMYIFWSLIIGYFVPIMIALFVSETVHWRGFFRIGTYIPNIVPGIATAFIFKYFFLSSDSGVLNILLGKIGIDAVPWINNAHLVIPIIVIGMTWRSAGATALIYIAGISDINPELYEAATIDGAGILKRVRHITFPSIFTLGKTMLILQVIAVFQIFYEPAVISGGGPNHASYSIMELVWDYAFKNFNYPGASAISVLVCIVLIILSGTYMKLTASRDKE